MKRNKQKVTDPVDIFPKELWKSILDFLLERKEDNTYKSTSDNINNSLFLTHTFFARDFCEEIEKKRCETILEAIKPYLSILLVYMKIQREGQDPKLFLNAKISNMAKENTSLFIESFFSEYRSLENAEINRQRVICSDIVTIAIILSSLLLALFCFLGTLVLGASLYSTKILQGGIIAGLGTGIGGLLISAIIFVSCRIRSSLEAALGDEEYRLYERECKEDQLKTYENTVEKMLRAVKVIEKAFLKGDKQLFSAEIKKILDEENKNMSNIKPQEIFQNLREMIKDISKNQIATFKGEIYEENSISFDSAYSLSV